MFRIIVLDNLLKRGWGCIWILKPVCLARYSADSDAPLAKNTAIYILIGIAAVYFALTALCLLLVVCVW